MPARAAIRANSGRARASTRSFAQAMNASWTSWGGTAVPMAFR